MRALCRDSNCFEEKHLFDRVVSPACNVCWNGVVSIVITFRPFAIDKFERDAFRNCGNDPIRSTASSPLLNMFAQTAGDLMLKLAFDWAIVQIFQLRMLQHRRRALIRVRGAEEARLFAGRCAGIGFEGD